MQSMFYFSSMLGMGKCAIQCCLFQPVNNNMVVLGSSVGYVMVVNISTGKSRKVRNMTVASLGMIKYALLS